MENLKKIKQLFFTFIAVLLFCSCNESSVVASTGNNNNNEEKKEEKVYSEKFLSYMDIGKTSEAEKDWLKALLAYISAINYSIDYDEAVIAYKAYYALAEIIKSGTPGRGNFDTFTNYAEWKKLLISAETYGNDFFPYELYFGSFQKANVNMEKKTADYYVTVSFTPNLLYQKTIGVISEGYTKADKQGWNDLPKDFPTTPITKEAIFSEIKNNSYIKGKVIPFAYTSPTMDEKVGLKNLKIIPYEGVFTITDVNGNVYAESKPYIIGTRDKSVGKNELDYIFGNDGYGGILKFSEVPEAGIKLIESGNAIISIKSLNLIYGQIETEYSISGRRTLVGSKRIEISHDVLIHNYGNKEIDRAKYIFTIIELLVDFFSPTTTFGNKKVTCVYFNPQKVSELLNGGENMTNTNMLFVMCNELSKIFGLKPVYLCNNSSAPCDFINDIEKLGMNSYANGFRLPDIDEIEKILSYAPSEKKLPKVIKNEGFFHTSYNYYSLSGNAQDDAYLMLYYMEP